MTEVTQALPFFDRRLLSAQPVEPGWWRLDSRFADAHGHWARTRLAAMRCAQVCGLPVAEARLLQGSHIEVRSTAWHVDTQLPLRTPFEVAGVRRGFEEEGGPDLAACFSWLDRHSASPIADVAALLRWVLVSFLLGHSEHHAGHIALTSGPAVGGRLRLAPVGWMTCFPALVTVGYTLAKGMRLGGQWPDDHLMVHHWVGVARAARVRPKVVFQLARELSETVPAALAVALGDVYRDQPRQAEALINRLLQACSKRSQRLLEVTMAAPAQGVAGLKRAPLAPPPEDPNEPPMPEWIREAPRMPSGRFTTIVGDSFG